MLSIPHLIIIFAVALVVFGPEKLPELARNLGKAMAEFRRLTGDMRSTFEEHMRELEREAAAKASAASTSSPEPTEPENRIGGVAGTIAAKGPADETPVNATPQSTPHGNN
ncbi:MAG: Sec-independent protein translocase subunit TatA/TatB [Candidatus Acidiferrales bacterium]